MDNRKINLLLHWQCEGPHYSQLQSVLKSNATSGEWLPPEGHEVGVTRKPVGQIYIS